jgi:hypothetical protein
MAANWKVSSREVSYQDIGDSIADSCTIIIAIHSSCASNVEPITLKTPPSVTPRPIGAFVWEPFNRIEHSLSPGRDDEEFDSKKMITTIPKPIASQQSRGVTVKYHLHRANSDATILAGSSVLSSGEVYAHHSNHAPIEISFSNSSELNLSTTATPTFALSRPMNLLIASD